MRHLLAAFAFLFLAQSALALRYKDILGTWTGTITEKADYSTDLKMVVRISYFGHGGLSTVEKITNAYGNVFISRRHLNGRGVFTQISTVGSNLFFRGSGTWTAGANSVQMQASLIYYNGMQLKQSTRFTFQKKRLSYYSKSTGGFTQTGILKRH